MANQVINYDKTQLTKADVGLSNVDNTSDVNKPVSIAQAAADDAVEAFSIQRSNHTGTQLAATISDFNAAVAAAGGGSNVGTAVIDFGAFPGKSDASVVVTGQAGILPGSTVQAWLKLADSADHSADEHMLETLKVFAGNIVAATGFTIYAVNDDKNIGGPPPPTTRIKGYGGGDTRIYGAWNVSWMWS